MTASFDPFIASGFDALIGSRITDLQPHFARAEFDVRDELRQPFGLLHGGVFASVAESLASIATGVEVLKQGKVATGLANQTSFLRPALEGTIEAVATCKHAGRTTWVWEVEFTDDHGRMCALTRMTIAVRDLPEGQQSPAA